MASTRWASEAFGFLLLIASSASLYGQAATAPTQTSPPPAAAPHVSATTTAGGGPNTTSAAQQTSTVVFANPLRIETPPAPRQPEPRWWQSPSVAAALIVSLGALLFNFLSFRQKEREIQLVNRQKDIEEERRSIYKQLNEFYGPVQQLLAVNKDIADAFYNGPRFRTLLRLLEGTVFTGNDAALLQQILQVNDELEKLIMTKSGLVDDDDLRKALSRQSSHIRILRLASTGTLTGDQKRFKKYVFPRKRDKDREGLHDGTEEGKQGDVLPAVDDEPIDVEARIDEHIKRLRRRLQELNTSQTTTRDAT